MIHDDAGDYQSLFKALDSRAAPRWVYLGAGTAAVVMNSSLKTGKLGSLFQVGHLHAYFIVRPGTAPVSRSLCPDVRLPTA